MPALPRESSFMPTIKCSTCGFQVEISMMGEHICSGGGEGSADPSPAPGLFGSLMSFAKPLSERPIAGRILPRVDTTAANRSYTGQGQLTPVSISSGSRSVSPKTPNTRPGAGRGDDYFAPKIANEYDSPPQGRRPGGYGGFGDSDGFDADPAYAASSPKKGGDLLQRMNSIAPGPFELNRRPTARNAFPARNNSMKSPQEMAPPSSNRYASDRPGTSSGTTSAAGSVAPPKFPRKNGYGGFGPPQKSQEDFEPQPFGMNRAETFPRPSEITEAPARTPSAPGPRPDRTRRPSNAARDMIGQVPRTAERSRRPSAGMGPDTSRPPPPRTSLVRSPTLNRRDGSRNLPAINFAAEFGNENPYHSPSASVSSSQSGSSRSDRPNQPSSRTSPARSLGSRSGRAPADTSGFDNLMSDLQSSMEDIKVRDLPPLPAQPPPFDKPSTLSARRPGPPPPDSRYDPAIQGPRSQPRSQSPLSSPTWGNSSRDDPAVQGSRRAPTTAQRPAPQSTRGDCKACRLPITGKSISSADGRLTGRYHKACFVCTTCTKPFASSTFYVIDDAPYCELHYHKLNGSLCGSCGVGIEGQYLEDEATKKYHPGCFRCGDCGKVLQDGYFEVNGEAFCERDAWKRVQQPWLAGAGSDGGQLSSGSPSRLGLPPRSGLGGPRPFGLPSGNKLGPRPRMEKRMTRLGMM